MNKLLALFVASAFALGSASGIAAEPAKKKEELSAEQKTEIRDRVERLKAELGPRTRVVATGGQATLIAKGSKYIEAVDDHLTLEGLRLYWAQTRNGRASREASRKR